MDSPPLSSSSHGKLNLASVRRLVSTINHHLHLLLSDPSRRLHLQTRLSSSLSSAAPSIRNPSRFSDHHALSSLFWGLHHALSSSPTRLASAERLLQIPALLDEDGSTADLPNRLLVSSSYFYLALVRRLRRDDWQASLHFLHSVLVSPLDVRSHLASDLCRALWPHALSDDSLRSAARSSRDWLMYYQVVSRADASRSIGSIDLRRKEKADADTCASHDGGWKRSLASLLEQQSIDESRIDGIYDEEYEEGFDIERLQEMLEDSQSDRCSESSFYSQVGSDESDMEIKEDPLEALMCSSDFSSPGDVFDRKISEEQSQSSSNEFCETSYLLAGKPRQYQVGDLGVSVVDEKDVRSCNPYKCYLDYGTPPGVSPAQEFGCFGQLPPRFIRREGFAELVPRGTFARRKLDFARIEGDCCEGNFRSGHDDMQVEFMGRFERAISTLCLSMDPRKSMDNSVGLEVMNVWEMLSHRSEVKDSTLSQQVIHQLLDILASSKEEKFIRASTLILLLLVIEDGSLLEDIKLRNSHLHDLTRALKRDVHEASILIYMVKPSPTEMKNLDLLHVLVEVACNSNCSKWGPTLLPLSPAAASLSIIEILITSFDSATDNMNLSTISSPQVLSRLVNVARNKILCECIALTGILIKCMRFNGNCRKFISQVTPVEPFLHLFRSNEKRAKCAALEYFHEILRMPRSSSMILLHQIRKQGGIGILHMLMACMQQVKQEHKLLAANLLLQLDMLDVPSGKSIFKEEALDVLIESMSKNCSTMQILSAFLLSNLGGTYAWSGEPYTAAWLAKKANLVVSLNNRNMIRNIDWHDPCLQETGMDTWSSKIAKGILKFGNSIFGALAKGFESKIRSVSRDSLIAAAWLACEMAIMSSNSLRHSACEILISGIVGFLHPGSEFDERILACLCIYNFASGKGMQQLMNFSEGARESLRRLSSTTWMAEELLKVTDHFVPTKPRVSCVHTQVLEAGKVGSGATSALIFYKGQLCGGYTDGSIKVWDIKGQTSRHLSEAKEHKKSITCFALFEPGNNLLSGSIDGTVRVWQMSQKKLHCVDTIELKEPICRMSTCGGKILVATRSKGLKICGSAKVIKTICRSKHVKCLAVTHARAYVGCTDSSVLDVDLTDDQEQEIRSPANIWQMQNKSINSIFLYKGLLYWADTSVEESSIKDWRKCSKRRLSIPTDKGSSVHEMAVVEDFIYLCSSSSPSTVQIWLRGKQQKVGRLSAGGKITSLLAANDIILCGTESGLVKGWIPL